MGERADDTRMDEPRQLRDFLLCAPPELVYLPATGLWSAVALRAGCFHRRRPAVRLLHQRGQGDLRILRQYRDSIADSVRLDVSRPAAGRDNEADPDRSIRQ